MSLLQWKHTTAAVQKTLAPTGTHWNALLTINRLSIRLYIFARHWHTVSRLNYVPFVENERTICLIQLLFKNDSVKFYSKTEFVDVLK